MTDSDLRHARLTYLDGNAFVAGAPDGPAFILDGDGQRGPSPMVALLIAAAGCSGLDVAAILKKKQVDLTHFSVEVSGRRRAEYPRRYTEITLSFHLAGRGLTEEKARRSVELSVEKYCSVLASLAQNIPVHTEIIISPESGDGSAIPES